MIACALRPHPASGILKSVSETCLRCADGFSSFFLRDSVEGEVLQARSLTRERRPEL